LPFRILSQGSNVGNAVSCWRWLPMQVDAHGTPQRMRLELAKAARIVGADGRVMVLGLRDGALLAWLALEGPTPRARLAQLLWPESGLEAARNALRQRLFHLRRTVGSDLVVGSHTLALAEGLSHDLLDADSVLGEAAHEFGTELRDWLLQQRERRHHRLCQSLVELANLAEAAHDLPDALSHATELLNLQPLSEEAHRRVMRLHYLAGDRPGALLAFDRCEQVLKDEVGVRPSPETLALLDTIEQSAPTAAGTTQLARAVPASVLRPPRLVGREAPWRALHEAWDAGRCVIVTGDGGMGKSRLLGDFAQSRGATLVVSARPGDARVVYASFSRLLRALPRTALLALEAPLRGELARLLPELGASPGNTGLRDDQERTRFFNAVSATLDNPAIGFEGIVFDDLHFADDASIELLQFVVSAGSVRRWAVAARAAEVSLPGSSLLEDFTAQPDSVRLALAPLTQQHVAELLDSLGIAELVGEERATSLLRHTGGNPLYLLETVKAWLTQQPGALPNRLPATANIGNLIERRIGRLSQPAVQLARCAAVAAPDFSIELASRVLGLRTLDLVDPWSELEAAQVLQADGAFAHDLIYEAALASVPQAIAVQLHGEIARWLVERRAAPVSVAGHAQSAGLWALAAPAWGEVGQAARRTGRFLEASAAFGRAADCHARAGDRAAAFEALREQVTARYSHAMDDEAQRLADALPGAATDDLQRLAALQTQLDYLLYRGDYEPMVVPGERALALASKLGRTSTQVDITVLLGGACFQRGRAAEGLSLLQPLEPWVREHGDASQQAAFFEILALSLVGTGNLSNALVHYQESLRLAREAGEEAHVAELIGHLALVHSRMGLADQAVALVRQAIAIVAAEEGADDTTHVAQKQARLAMYLRDTGHYGEAIALCERLVDRFQAEGLSAWASACELGLAQAFIDLGQVARAQRLLNELAERPLGPMTLRLHWLRCELAWQMGRGASEAALRVLDPALVSEDQWLSVSALVASRAWEPQRALALLQQAIDDPANRECRGVRSELHARASEAARLAKDDAAATRHAQLALSLAQGHLGSRLCRAEIAWQAYLSLAAAGQRDAADAALGEGIDMLRVTLTHVPQPFRHSFLEQNSVNRSMLAAGRERGLLLGL
jgi:DNA-binding SARP family transcriptional activator/tetratricopeptide (TPR) repeat protein